MKCVPTLLFTVLTVFAGACSSDNTQSPTPDARPRPDAPAGSTPDAAGGGAIDAPPANAIDASVANPSDGSPAQPDANPAAPDAAISASATIGPAGGTITSSGVTVKIPRHALDKDTRITISDNVGGAPAGAHTPVVEIGPAGPIFSRPVTIEFTSSAANVSCFWTAPGGGAFEELTSSAAGGKVSCQVVQLGRGYLGDANGDRTIYGMTWSTYIRDSGITNVPSDLSADKVKAVVGANVYTGAGSADGWFAIAGVPNGVAWIVDGSVWMETDLGMVDLGSDLLGRSDAAPQTMASPFVFNVTNMEAWKATDQLEFFAPNTDSWAFDVTSFATAGAPAANATMLTALTADPGTVGPWNLIKNDPFVLAQLSEQTTGQGVKYLSMARVFEPAAFTQVDGTPTTVTGAFTVPGSSMTVSADFKASQFVTSTPLGPTGTSAPQIFFYVVGQPNGLDDGIYSASADFVIIGPTTSDVNGQNMSYHMPTAGTWGTYYLGQNNVTKSYAVTGGTAFPFSDFIFVAGPLSDLSAPVVPTLGPPRAPTIAGKDGFTNQTGVGLTPIISWQAPATGTPKEYSVSVIQILRGSLVFAGQFHTTGTSVTLPAGILKSGSSYFFSIFENTGAFPRTAPFRSDFPTATGKISSGIFTP